MVLTEITVLMVKTAKMESPLMKFGSIMDIPERKKSF